jgi:hypothetical protein
MISMGTVGVERRLKKSGNIKAVGKQHFKCSLFLHLIFKTLIASDDYTTATHL